MAKRISVFCFRVFAFLMIFSCQNSSTYICCYESAVLSVQTEYNGNWGMVDGDGKILFADEYKHEPTCASDGLFSVQEGIFYAVYSAEASPSLISGCDDLVSVGQYKEGVIPITHENSRISIVDGKGNVKSTLNPIDGKEIVGCSPYCNEDLFVVIDEDNNHGFVDKEGKMVIKPVYEHAGPFSDGVSLVRINENNELTNIVINRNGMELFRLKRDLFPESDCFMNGLLKVRNSDDTWGFVDVKGVFIKAKGNVKRIGDYNRDSFTYMNGDLLWGIMGMNGEVLIRPTYSFVSYLPDGKYLVRTEDQYFVLDNTGNRLYSIEGYNDIRPLNKGVISFIAQDGSIYKLLGNNGKPINNNVYYGFGNKDYLVEFVETAYFNYDSIIGVLVDNLSDGGYKMISVNMPAADLGIVNYSPYVGKRFYKIDSMDKKGWKYEVNVSVVTDDFLAFNGHDGSNSEVFVNQDAKVESILMVCKTTGDYWRNLREKLITAIQSKGYKLIYSTDSSLDFKGTNSNLCLCVSPNGENIILKIESNRKSTNEKILYVGKNKNPISTGEKLSLYNAQFFRGKQGYLTTQSGMKYVTVVEGTGATPKANDNVTVHYTARLLDGTIVDTSINRKSPSIFPLNSLIKGRREALQLMKVGGVAVFYIPSNLAYGETGAPGTSISPNTDLIFEIQLIGIE